MAKALVSQKGRSMMGVSLLCAKSRLGQFQVPLSCCFLSFLPSFLSSPPLSPPNTKSTNNQSSTSLVCLASSVCTLYLSLSECLSQNTQKLRALFFSFPLVFPSCAYGMSWPWDHTRISYPITTKYAQPFLVMCCLALSCPVY